jgi:hypothetical protein
MRLYVIWTILIMNPEKLTTLGTLDTRRRQTKQKHNTVYVGHHYAQTQIT